MSCSCSKGLADGRAIADHIRIKGKENQPPLIAHDISCECGESFILEKVIMDCPKCGMTYAVTPCSSADPGNIRQAGIHYA